MELVRGSGSEGETAGWRTTAYAKGGGWPVTSMLRAQRTIGRPVPLPIAMHVTRSVCAILSYGTELRTAEHGRGGHGAVCAQNVMVYEDGSVGLRGATDASATGISLDERTDARAVADLLLELAPGRARSARPGTRRSTPCSHERAGRRTAAASTPSRR